ncbi:MAG: hypothetical protein LBQ57_04730, partial [Spirochaetales bacterium]|nr:hypothetical protein [Spirochaetales bacterium]
SRPEIAVKGANVLPAKKHTLLNATQLRSNCRGSYEPYPHISVIVSPLEALGKCPDRKLR